MAPRKAKTWLLLDLHARRDGFLSSETFLSVKGQIEAQGHAVFHEQLVASDAESPEVFRRAVGARAEASGADIVVVSRAWDEALVRAIRSGLPSAVVARLSFGARAALDETFDHVLDPAGLMLLAAGEAAPPQAEYKKTTAADLRLRLRTAGPPAELPPSPFGRPTISGPSSGCPFLLDARQNPVFASAGLDPATVQTKGCTFCLDNSGAFVVPKEADVVRVWIERLRLIHKSYPTRPARLEALLTDERPHPYLPAFFEALSAEPELLPLTLLWKSRADWLIEYADEVARACEIAARSGSVLHLYLVGFESFDRWHLDLFNKGHGPEVNEAAIALMRQLGERYPTSFEYKRYRSHGIVLFTPWTEPAALLENARWMRRLRFDELRSEAIKTRLRLYPQVPLYHLAERDGLLTDRFAAGRGDRAAEQGYDASAPWRFRDERTEAIFQLSGQLHEADRSLSDADILETATRFVLRFPGLAREPGLAHLPFRAAIEAWGAPLGFVVRELGPAAAAFDPEIEAIGRTSKRAALKESVRGADAEDMARAYRAMGLAAEVALTHTMERKSGFHREGHDHAIIAIAADGEALGEALAAQRALFSTRDRTEQAAAVRALGALMGYPECCVEAFAGQSDRGDNQANERAPFVRHPEAKLHPLLHRTGAVRWIAHHVCSPGCTASIARAERVLELLRQAEGGDDAASRVLAVMQVPSLFLDYERFASVRGAWEGATFRVTGSLAIGRCREMEDLVARARAIRLSPPTVTFTLADGAERTLPAESPLLVEPGEPVAPPALAALASKAEKDTPRAFSAESRLPGLFVPPAVRPGVRAGAFVIVAVDRAEDRCVVHLRRGEEQVRVELRPHVEDRPYTIRKGRWAIDVAEANSLSEPAKVAIGALVRTLSP